MPCSVVNIKMDCKIEPHIGICALNRIRKSLWYIISFYFEHTWCKCAFNFQEYLRAHIQVRTCLYWKRTPNKPSLNNNNDKTTTKPPSLPSCPFQHKRIKYASLPPQQVGNRGALREKWGIRGAGAGQQEAGGCDFIMEVGVPGSHGSKCCGDSSHPSREGLLFQLEFQTGMEWDMSWGCLNSVVMREAWFDDAMGRNVSREYKQKVCQYLYFSWHWYYSVLCYQVEWSQSQQPLPLTGWGVFLV